MIKIIFIILIFLLGFCVGGLWEIKNSLELIRAMDKQNKEWASLCEKQNNDWSEYCQSLIDKIKTLKSEVEEK